MNREEALEHLVKYQSKFGNISAINDWILQDDQYVRSLHDPITIDDWNRAKIVPDTVVEIKSIDHLAYINSLADHCGFVWMNSYDSESTPENSEWKYLTFNVNKVITINRSKIGKAKEIFIEMPEPNINARVLAEKVGSKHSHYFKDVSDLDEVDVYRVCDLFEVNDPSGAKQHAIKKLLCSGQRGAKDERKDLEEARDTIIRKLAMMTEDGE